LHWRTNVYKPFFLAKSFCKPSPLDCYELNSRNLWTGFAMQTVVPLNATENLSFPTLLCNLGVFYAFFFKKNYCPSISLLWISVLQLIDVVSWSLVFLMRQVIGASTLAWEPWRSKELSFFLFSFLFYFMLLPFSL